MQEETQWHRVVAWEKLAEIVEARAEELLSMMHQEIKRSGYDGLLPAGVVLCGGTAQLPGILELGRDTFGLPVRMGSPQEFRGFVDKVSGPAHAVCMGLMEWGVTMDTRPRLRKSSPGPGRRFLDWLQAFLPG